MIYFDLKPSASIATLECSVEKTEPLHGMLRGTGEIRLAGDYLPLEESWPGEGAAYKPDGNRIL